MASDIFLENRPFYPPVSHDEVTAPKPATEKQVPEAVVQPATPSAKPATPATTTVRDTFILDNGCNESSGTGGGCR